MVLLWLRNPCEGLNLRKGVSGNGNDRADLVDVAQNWLWSSAHAQLVNNGLVPDHDSIPMLMI